MEENKEGAGMQGCYATGSMCMDWSCWMRVGENFWILMQFVLRHGKNCW